MTSRDKEKYKFLAGGLIAGAIISAVVPAVNRAVHSLTNQLGVNG